MFQIPNNLKPVEDLLTQLAPDAGRLNRDRMLFEAGRAAAPRRLGWPVSAIMLAGLSSILTLQLMSRPELTVRTIEVVRYVSPAAPSFVETTANAADEMNESHMYRSSSSYLSLRDRVVRFGVDALPASPAFTDRPMPLETVERGTAHRS